MHSTVSLAVAAARGLNGMHHDYSALVAALSARIKSIRQARGLTQMNMVQLYGYHQSDWQGIETGRRMSLRILARVANSFDMTVAELFDGIERQDGSGYGSRGFTPPPGTELDEE